MLEFSFNEFVDIGRKTTTNIVNGMPWSFIFMGNPVSHENDECYIIHTPFGAIRFTINDILVSNINGDLSIKKKEENKEMENQNETIQRPIGEPIKFTPAEKKRVYHFPKGEKVILENVCELVVRESGTHRLKTSDGKSHIIPTGWIHIELEIEDWTV